MLQATGGINTHRGAVFTLGLICAAAGSRQRLMGQWGEALQARRQRTSASNGQRAARALGLRSVGEEAALGFPIVFECAVPALAEARRQGLSDQAARLQTLFHIMARLDDTNLAHRGGLAGLRFAQSQAHEFLQAGGAARPDALAHAQRIHQAFIARRLSPGGAADVLAAAGLIERLGQQSS
jgi:triphosphoribosyl-dephospho-CoA synthase